MAREAIPRLDFIKIDVQGAEALVFRGGLRSLATHKPAIYCELSPGLPECVVLTIDDAIHLLSGLGYEMFVADESTGRIETCPRHTPAVRDYLFLHPDNPVARPA